MNIEKGQPPWLPLFLIYKARTEKVMRRFIKCMIGYTLSDDELRDEFRQCLGLDFGGNLEWVNESMYALKKGDPKNIRRYLKEMWEGVEKDKETDFVKLYYATHWVNLSNKNEGLNEIVEVTIW